MLGYLSSSVLKALPLKLQKEVATRLGVPDFPQYLQLRLLAEQLCLGDNHLLPARVNPEPLTLRRVHVKFRITQHRLQELTAGDQLWVQRQSLHVGLVANLIYELIKRVAGLYRGATVEASSLTLVVLI